MATNESNKAIYLQIADRICDDVMMGKSRPDERIASVRDFAATMQVNSNTVMRSYEWLEREGIIYNKRGIGFFISPDAREKIIQIRRTSFLNNESQYFFKQLMTIGITPAQLAEMYGEFIKKNSNQ